MMSSSKLSFDAIPQLMTPTEKPRRKIGFKVKEKRAAYGTSKRRTAEGRGQKVESGGRKEGG